MLEATVKTLAEQADGRVVGDANCIVSGVANLASAKAGELSFLANEKYLKHLATTKASVVIIKEEHLSQCPSNAIVVVNPYLAYAKIASYLTQQPRPLAAIHPSAVINDTAEIHESAHIGPHVVIEAGARIEKNVSIAANCFIGGNVVIGESSTVNANVSIYANTKIGAKVIIHSGAVLGADGFGFANDQGQWVKIPQVGQVVIGNSVEIGANSTIDCGAIDNTIIHDGVKIDNLVHIGHNVEIGDHTALAAFVGISGSTKIGKYCTLGGAAGINGHIEIADHVHLGGMCMVTKSLKQAGQYASGIPAEPAKQWRKNVVRFRQIEKLTERIKNLETELTLLKGS